MGAIEQVQEFFSNRYRETPDEKNIYTDLSAVQPDSTFDATNARVPEVNATGEVEVIRLTEALESNPEDLRKVFSELFSRQSDPRRAERKHFLFPKSLLNGFFVRVLHGGEAEIEIGYGKGGGAGFNVFLIEEAAAAKIIEIAKDSNSLNSTELFLSSGASADFASINSQPDSPGFLFSKRRFFLGEGARASCFSGFFGGAPSVAENEFVLRGRGAHARDYQASFASGRQHFDLSSLVRHEAPSTKFQSVARSCLKDEGRSVLWGKIVIEKGAGQADSFLSQKCLLLNSGARADAMPVLEIEENDVRATHASSVSHVDENAVFYLGSRGIPPADGKKIVAESFLESAFEKSLQQKAGESLAEQISLKW